MPALVLEAALQDLVRLGVQAVKCHRALIGGISIGFVGAHRLQDGFVAHQPADDDLTAGQKALHVAFLWRRAAHLHQDVAEFGDMAQMVALEFAQPSLPAAD